MLIACFLQAFLGKQCLREQGTWNSVSLREEEKLLTSREAWAHSWLCRWGLLPVRLQVPQCQPPWAPGLFKGWSPTECQYLQPIVVSSIQGVTLCSLGHTRLCSGLIAYPTQVRGTDPMACPGLDPVDCSPDKTGSLLAAAALWHLVRIKYFVTVACFLPQTSLNKGIIEGLEFQ